MTTTAVAPSSPLSTLLREGSQTEHHEAEGSSFMSELLAGHVDGRGYAHYLTLMRRVYDALESVASELRDDPLAGVVIDPALERLAAIDADLAFWSRGEQIVVDSPATDRYVARIHDAAQWGGLFVAHHYTRYLGDLSGGQAIGRLLSRTFDLDGEGVAFYDFPGIPKPKVYKDGYRARLDTLDLDDAQRGRMLDEVRAVFGLNGGVFAELSTKLDEYRMP